MSLRFRSSANVLKCCSWSNMDGRNAYHRAVPSWWSRLSAELRLIRREPATRVLGHHCITVIFHPHPHPSIYTCQTELATVRHVCHSRDAAGNGRLTVNVGPPTTDHRPPTPEAYIMLCSERRFTSHFDMSSLAPIARIYSPVVSRTNTPVHCIHSFADDSPYVHHLPLTSREPVRAGLPPSLEATSTLYFIKRVWLQLSGMDAGCWQRWARLHRPSLRLSIFWPIATLQCGATSTRNGPCTGFDDDEGAEPDIEGTRHGGGMIGIRETRFHNPARSHFFRTVPAPPTWCHVIVLSPTLQQSMHENESNDNITWHLALLCEPKSNHIATTSRHCTRSQMYPQTCSLLIKAYFARARLVQTLSASDAAQNRRSAFNSVHVVGLSEHQDSLYYTTEATIFQDRNSPYAPLTGSAPTTWGPYLADIHHLYTTRTLLVTDPYLLRIGRFDLIRTSPLANDILPAISDQFPLIPLLQSSVWTSIYECLDAVGAYCLFLSDVSSLAHMSLMHCESQCLASCKHTQRFGRHSHFASPSSKISFLFPCINYQVVRHYQSCVLTSRTIMASIIDRIEQKNCSTCIRVKRLDGMNDHRCSAHPTKDPRKHLKISQFGQTKMNFHEQIRIETHSRRLVKAAAVYLPRHPAGQREMVLDLDQTQDELISTDDALRNRYLHSIIRYHLLINQSIISHTPIPKSPTPRSKTKFHRHHAILVSCSKYFP
ncbi:uncharacterized protein MYCFIDRAFT_176324 [Pseudocercospora fijiensis CIRAD86]|uniref:Uncharacterized protein n=1 Tax=Pseudocercospora fijiensis (strain CIRAD86) TaxID=383855 RepID=M3AUZ2_PSEFD|nr:uncharacterized protein MYCFIDRAFT_176324 [Pseudocercospora fijiensis CIRAD86]EME80978.1 hypothetical protein MYCFIDRAFT_176324 [Pseudocercospora fijiensis CIRAD86]